MNGEDAITRISRRLSEGDDGDGVAHLMSADNTLGRAVETLDLLDLAGRVDFMHMAAFESDGFYKPADPDNGWDTRQVEIKAYGVFATGGTDADAIRHWMQAAARQARLFEDLRRAEALLHHKGLVPREDMCAACKLILAEGRETAQRNMAAAMLKALGRAA